MGTGFGDLSGCYIVYTGYVLELNTPFLIRLLITFSPRYGVSCIEKPRKWWNVNGLIVFMIGLCGRREGG
jgi:hypothetical protein